MNNNLLDFLSKNRKTNDFLTGTVYTLSPLTVKIIPTDDAINVVSTSNLLGIQTGSRVLLLRYLDQFIAIAVINKAPLERCILRKTSSQSIPDTTFTKIEFGSGTEESDVLGMHDTATNNTRITIPSDGLYSINISGRWTNSTSGSARLLYVYINNSQYMSISNEFDSSGRAANNGTINLPLETDDYVELAVYQATGGSLSFGGSGYSSVYFSVIKL